MIKHRMLSVYHRLFNEIYGRILGVRCNCAGGRGLQIVRDMETIQIFNYVTEVYIDSSDTLWFFCLYHKDHNFDFPEPEPGETYLSCTKRIEKLPGINKMFFMCHDYSSISIDAYYEYDTRTDYIYRQLPFYHSEDKSSNKVTPFKVVADKNAKPDDEE